VVVAAAAAVPFFMQKRMTPTMRTTAAALPIAIPTMAPVDSPVAASHFFLSAESMKSVLQVVHSVALSHLEQFSRQAVHVLAVAGATGATLKKPVLQVTQLPTTLQ
jgi:hypothetical protein